MTPPPLFDRLIKLEVQLDPDFSRGDFVQQQPAVGGAFALHLLLYGCHGNLGATEEILKRQNTFSIATQKHRGEGGGVGGGGAPRPRSPSGENWSFSKTVRQRTSWYRSLMKNWQWKFHFGFRVSLMEREV